MSTSAIIVFRDSHESAYIRRGHDGFPEDVLPDLFDLVEAVTKWPGWGGRWSGSEIGQLTALFFAMTGDPAQRLQPYDWAQGPAGDEEYLYVVGYHHGEWTITVDSETAIGPRLAIDPRLHNGDAQ